ncbi:MAG: ABC transporter substrate-binding protein [Deltaproteobacteria bacterium]|nr:ABC transporter substrate-binding protein [Deltaproteobacteria bacterium]
MTAVKFALLLSAMLFFSLTADRASRAANSNLLVGVLVPEYLRSESQVIKGLKQGLEEAGYKEKKNLFIEMRNAKGNRGALDPLARELLSRKVAAILTTGTRATRAALSASANIPVVFCHPADPVALGLVKTMERPGGNATGVAGLALQATHKRVEVLRTIVPGTRRVLIFYDANNPNSQENFRIAQTAASKQGLQVSPHPVKSTDELKVSMSALQVNDGDVLFQVSDDLVDGQAAFIFEEARKKKLPTIFNDEMWAINGAMLAYGPSYFEMGHQAAGLVTKISRGEKPAALPVEQVRKFDLVINYRAARVIGQDIPRALVKKADRVIW